MENKTFGPFIIKEYETLDESQNQVKVAVKALRPITSRNGRKYTFDEIKESHKTMRRKPINVNHDDTKHIGHIDGSRITEQQIMEVYGIVNKEPYVYMVKTHDPRITGWSVQADFKIAKCTHCSKEFQSMEILKKHLIEEEHIHNISFEPVDIEFSGLALVMSPEVPGVPNTSHEIMETTKNLLTLEETVDKLEAQNDLWLLNKISNKIKENPIMSKISVSQEASHIAIGKGKDLISNAPASVNLPLTSGKSEEKKVDQTVQKTQVNEPSTPLTQTIEIPTTLITETKTPKTITLKEQAKIGKLTFKEEECTPFEQCVKDGGSPEECARKYKEVKERNESMKLIANTVNEIIDVVSPPLTFTLPPEPAPFNDAPLREMIMAIPKDDLGWKDVKPYNDAELREMIATIKPYDDSKIQEFIKSYQPYNDKEIKEALATIKPYDDKALKEMIAAIPKDDVTWKEIKPYDDKPIKEALAAIKPFDPAPILSKIDEMAKTIPTAYNDKPIIEQLTKLSESIKENQTLKETLTKLTDEFKTVKEAYEANLAAYKKDLKEYWEPLKTKQENQAKELQSIKETAEKAKVIAENADDKIQPVFKGHNKSTVNDKQTPNFTYNPTGAP